MGIISWIVMGLIVGSLAKILLPGRDPGGIFVTIIIGIAGAFIGGVVSSIFGYGRFTGFNFRSIIIAVFGSIILLVAYRIVRGRRRIR